MGQYIDSIIGGQILSLFYIFLFFFLGMPGCSYLMISGSSLFWWWWSNSIARIVVGLWKVFNKNGIDCIYWYSCMLIMFQVSFFFIQKTHDLVMIYRDSFKKKKSFVGGKFDILKKIEMNQFQPKWSAIFTCPQVVNNDWFAWCTIHSVNRKGWPFLWHSFVENMKKDISKPLVLGRLHFVFVVGRFRAFDWIDVILKTGWEKQCRELDNLWGNWLYRSICYNG